jgi:oligopeptide transport system permease protein
MAVAENQSSTSGSSIPKLDKPVKGKSLWMDSWYRLRRNKAALFGAIILILTLLMAVFAPQIAPYPYDDQNLLLTNVVPLWVTKIFPSMIPQGETGGYVKISDVYALGGDSLGRDILSRIIYGTRVSMSVAIVGPFVAIVVGLIVGLIAGYSGGKVDNFLMRIVDLMYAFPTILLIILMMAFFRAGYGEYPPGSIGAAITNLDRATGGMMFIFIGIGLTSWMGMARLVRGQVLSVREKEYIEAARSLGTRRYGIMGRHIVPNILGTLIIAETLTIPTYIAYEAFLSFIGLGVNPPTPSWGSMIAEGAQRITSYPNQALFPAVALFLVMFAFNFLGDGLRDALDPRMRGVD